MLHLLIYIRTYIGIPAFYYWALRKGRTSIMTRNGDYKDRLGNIVIAMPTNLTESEKISRDSDLDALDFLYSAYGILHILHIIPMTYDKLLIIVSYCTCI